MDLETRIAQALEGVATAGSESERKTAAQSAAREIAAAVKESSKNATAAPIRRQTGLKFDANRNVYRTEVQFIPQLDVKAYLGQLRQFGSGFLADASKQRMNLVFNNIRQQLPILNAQINAQGENIQGNIFGFKGFAYDAANAALGLGEKIAKPLLEYLRPMEMMALNNSVRDNFAQNFSGIKLATAEGEEALTRYTIAMMRANNMSSPQEISNFFQAMKFSARATEPEMLAFNKFVSDAASSLQIPYEVGLKNFTYTIDQLGYSGEKGVRIFKGLQAAQLATGVDFQKLGGIFERGMQTFDGIANTAGKLNAVLGISIDPMQLASMTADERFEYIQDAISQSGMDVTDPLIQRELESILGGSQTTRRILRSSTDEYDKILARIKSANVTQYRDLESANAAVTGAEKLALQRSRAVPGFQATQEREAIQFNLLLKQNQDQFTKVENLALTGARTADALTLLVSSIARGEIKLPADATGAGELEAIMKQLPQYSTLLAQVGSAPLAAAITLGKTLAAKFSKDVEGTARKIEALSGPELVEAQKDAALALSNLILESRRKGESMDLKVLLQEFENSAGGKKITEQLDGISAIYEQISKQMSETFKIDITNFEQFVKTLKVAILKL